MLMQAGDQWHCTNSACRSALSVGLSREIPGDHVSCVCGGIMKKHYTPPVFRYLEFIGEPDTKTVLRFEAPARQQKTGKE